MFCKFIRVCVLLPICSLWVVSLSLLLLAHRYQTGGVDRATARPRPRGERVVASGEARTSGGRAANRECGRASGRCGAEAQRRHGVRPAGWRCGSRGQDHHVRRQQEGGVHAELRIPAAAPPPPPPPSPSLNDDPSILFSSSSFAAQHLLHFGHLELHDLCEYALQDRLGVVLVPLCVVHRIPVDAL